MKSMEKHNLLQDNYEDALFALLMDELAEKEGERLMQENERLLQDPSTAVPAESERRMLQVIERETAKHAHRRSSGKILHILGRFAIGALIAVLLFGSAFALSPSFRASTLNLLMQIDDKFTSWQFVSESNSNELSPSQYDINVGWLPDGYISSLPISPDPQNIVMQCSNSSGKSIIISAHFDYAVNHFLDTEEIEYGTPIVVRDHLGILITKDDITRLAWVDETTGIAVFIQSADVGSDTLLRIAENISFSQ